MKTKLKKQANKRRIQATGLTVIKLPKRTSHKCKPGDFLIEPTTEARMKFIKKFIPKWVVLCGGDDWEVAHRLSEEIQDNFQFVDKSVPVKAHEGLLRQDVSLAHILVMQQLEILKQRGQLKTLQVVLKRNANNQK